MMRAIQLGAPLSSRLATRWAARLWFKPGRFPEPPQEKTWRESARPVTVEHHGQPLSVHAWGPDDGPVVLLVHGWNGRGMQLGALSAPLVAAGFRVVTFDLPAHGRSPGEKTDFIDFSDAIMAVSGVCGEPSAVIAHSFGAMATLYSVVQGLKVGRVVALAPPAEMREIADRFCELLNLPDSVQTRFYRRLEEQFGPDCWERFSPIKMVPKVEQPGLVIHDETDGDVPWQDGEAVASAWPGAQFVKTSGLGHRRLMRDPDVIARITAFVTSGNSPAS